MFSFMIEPRENLWQNQYNIVKLKNKIKKENRKSTQINYCKEILSKKKKKEEEDRCCTWGLEVWWGWEPFLDCEVCFMIMKHVVMK